MPDHDTDHRTDVMEYRLFYALISRRVRLRTGGYIGGATRAHKRIFNTHTAPPYDIPASKWSERVAGPVAAGRRGVQEGGRGDRASDEDERGCSRRTFTKRTESPRHVGEEPDTIRAQDRCYDVRSPLSPGGYYCCITTTEFLPKATRRSKRTPGGRGDI